MASLYIICDTAHPLWLGVMSYLQNMRGTCLPSFNNNGDKALIQLKDEDSIPPWPIHNILSGEGVYWAGSREELYTQEVVDMAEWNVQKAPGEP